MLFLLAFLTLCNGQTKNFDYAKTIKEQAEIMGQLLLKKDFISFINFIDTLSNSEQEVSYRWTVLRDITCLLYTSALVLGFVN